jgi:class 3 adenylate cyclase
VPRSTALERPDAFLERHLRQEAIEGEILVARVRLVAVAALLMLELGLFALTEDPSRHLALIGVAAFGVLYAGFVLVAVRRGLFRRRTVYTTTLTDVALLTGGVWLTALASGDITEATKGLVPPVFFLIVVLSSLRLHPRVPVVAGLAAGGALLLLLLPVFAFAPQDLVWTDFRDYAAARVSPVRVGIVSVALVGAGYLLSMSTRYMREALRRSLHTVTFFYADLRGFTSLTEELGDAAAARMINEYRAIVRAELTRFHGAELKTEGDSLLAEFTRATEALRCSLAVLERASARNVPGTTPMSIGIGLHAGEPVAVENDYVGAAVNVAARLGSAAGAGEILVSDVVRGLTRTADLPMMVEREGLSLKGVSDLRAYSVMP